MTHASSAHSISPSAWIYFGLCGITVVDAFLHSEFLVQIGVGLIVVFMVLEFRRVPAPQKISATVLIVLAVIAAGLTGKWDAIILEGISRARIFSPTETTPRRSPCTTTWNRSNPVAAARPA